MFSTSNRDWLVPQKLLNQKLHYVKRNRWVYCCCPTGFTGPLWFYLSKPIVSLAFWLLLARWWPLCPNRGAVPRSELIVREKLLFYESEEHSYGRASGRTKTFGRERRTIKQISSVWAQRTIQGLEWGTTSRTNKSEACEEFYHYIKVFLR